MADTLTRNFPVTNFKQVNFNALGSIQIIQDGSESLVAEGSQEALEHIKVDQDGGQLNIRLYTWYDFFFFPHPARYTLHVKDLEAFSISGSAEMECERLESPRLDMSISGSGRCQVGELKATSIHSSASGNGDFTVANIAASDISASLSGSGRYRLAGTAERLSVRISGSGEVEAQQLQVIKEEVHISGSAKVTTSVSESLDIHISGSGEILYTGAPQITQSVSGSASIRKL